MGDTHLLLAVENKVSIFKRIRISFKHRDAVTKLNSCRHARNLIKPKRRSHEIDEMAPPGGFTGEKSF